MNPYADRADRYLILIEGGPPSGSLRGASVGRSRHVAVAADFGLLAGDRGQHADC